MAEVGPTASSASPGAANAPPRRSRVTIVERLTADGIRRLGTAKRGFRYRRADGRRLGAADLARIAGLRIPPAWTEVAIHPSERAPVQAIGKDVAGRWQYLYHARQVARRERAKQERLVHFIQRLPSMRRAIARDLAQPGMGREKVLAGIARILATCFLRPGSDEYASAHGSYGLTTLRRRHVTVRGDVIVFDFVGKSARRQQHEIRDRRLARLVRELLRHPGEVFKFRDDDGVVRDVKRHHINAYLKEVMGERFSAKDFRTWAGTLLCACALAREAPEGSARGRKRQIAAAIREVAERLGNTPAVCRASYVFPAVLQAFEQGRVIPHAAVDLTALERGRARNAERSERALLKLIAGLPAGRSMTNGRENESGARTRAPLVRRSA